MASFNVGKSRFTRTEEGLVCVPERRVALSVLYVVKLSLFPLFLLGTLFLPPDYVPAYHVLAGLGFSAIAFWPFVSGFMDVRVAHRGILTAVQRRFEVRQLPGDYRAAAAVSLEVDGRVLDREMVRAVRLRESLMWGAYILLPDEVVVVAESNERREVEELVHLLCEALDLPKEEPEGTRLTVPFFSGFLTPFVLRFILNLTFFSLSLYARMMDPSLSLVAAVLLLLDVVPVTLWFRAIHRSALRSWLESSFPNSRTSLDAPDGMVG
jgi:hypothetical protein